MRPRTIASLVWAIAAVVFVVSVGGTTLSPSLATDAQSLKPSYSFILTA